MSDQDFDLGYNLKRLVNVLANTKPSRENKKEWELIREQSVKWNLLISENRFQAALDGILFTFYNTHPKAENKKEWEAIRDVSNQILSTQPEPAEGLNMLATKLSNTTPAVHNTKEWKEISSVAKEIVQ